MKPAASRQFAALRRLARARVRAMGAGGLLAQTLDVASWRVQGSATLIQFKMTTDQQERLDRLLAIFNAGGKRNLTRQDVLRAAVEVWLEEAEALMRSPDVPTS